MTYHPNADQLNVRGNWVEETFAVLNGAPTFLYDPQNLDLPFHISLDLPDGWPDVHTALPQTGTVYIAEDLDTLIDTPWLMGTTTAYTFDVEGIPHTFVNWGEQMGWSAIRRRCRDDCTRAHPILGRYPISALHFLNVLSEAEVGLNTKTQHS